MSVDSIPIEWTPRGAVVSLPEEIDLLSTEQVRTALDDALSATPAVLVADMTLTTYCCSEGLRILLEIRQAAQQAGIPMRIAGMHTRVRRILTLTGTDRMLDMYPTVEEAMTPRKIGLARRQQQTAATALPPHRPHSTAIAPLTCANDPHRPTCFWFASRRSPPSTGDD